MIGYREEFARSPEVTRSNFAPLAATYADVASLKKALEPDANGHAGTYLPFDRVEQGGPIRLGISGYVSNSADEAAELGVYAVRPEQGIGLGVQRAGLLTFTAKALASGFALAAGYFLAEPTVVDDGILSTLTRAPSDVTPAGVRPGFASIYDLGPFAGLVLLPRVDTAAGFVYTHSKWR